MLPYAPVAYRPSVTSPRLGRRDRPSLGQTFDQMFLFPPVMGDIIRLLFHGATSYLGIFVGSTQKGFISGLGWVLGIGQGIGALTDAISIGMRIAGTHPREGPQTAEESTPNQIVPYMGKYMKPVKRDVAVPKPVLPGQSVGPVVYGTRSEQLDKNRSKMLRKTAAPKGWVGSYPYIVKVKNGEYVVNADGTATFWNGDMSHWEPTENIEESDLFPSREGVMMGNTIIQPVTFGVRPSAPVPAGLRNGLTDATIWAGAFGSPMLRSPAMSPRPQTAIPCPPGQGRPGMLCTVGTRRIG